MRLLFLGQAANWIYASSSLICVSLGEFGLQGQGLGLGLSGLGVRVSGLRLWSLGALFASSLVWRAWVYGLWFQGLGLKF